ncbi:cation:proton antiporter subunit C [Kineococcus sp. SYSU DK004]|uniref:cation:proton antiporter subunit C n=1 Tax=Kineococcus sp. SYSU DK004 TaxID=3383125 RepID=UPI003D7D256C
MILALTVGVVVAGAVYLLLQREMVRVVLGFVLLGHAANLVIMAAGGVSRRGEPLGAEPDPALTADPLPQAFVLTAIVIAFSITMYMLALAVLGRRDDELARGDAADDDEPDGPADRGGDESSAHDAPARREEVAP